LRCCKDNCACIYATQGTLRGHCQQTLPIQPPLSCTAIIHHFHHSQLHETSNNNAFGVEFNQRQMINNHEESEHEEEEEDDDEIEDFIEVTA